MVGHLNDDEDNSAQQANKQLTKQLNLVFFTISISYLDAICSPIHPPKLLRGDGSHDAPLCRLP